MTTIYLIRHGENDFLGKKLAGWLPGVHLNDRGREQAEALGRALKGTRLQAVYASPLERTMETAEPIARDQGLEVTPRPGLGEIRIGRWEGQSLKMVRRRKLWQTIQQAPSLARFPEGESYPEAQARVVAELEALRALHPGPRASFACVSHSDVIKIAIAHYLGLPLDLFQRLVVQPASVSVLHIDHGSVRLSRLNDTCAIRDRPPQ